MWTREEYKIDPNFYPIGAKPRKKKKGFVPLSKTIFKDKTITISPNYRSYKAIMLCKKN